MYLLPEDEVKNFIVFNVKLIRVIDLPYNPRENEVLRHIGEELIGIPNRNQGYEVL